MSETYRVPFYRYVDTIVLNPDEEINALLAKIERADVMTLFPRWGAAKLNADCVRIIIATQITREPPSDSDSC